MIMLPQRETLDRVIDAHEAFLKRILNDDVQTLDYAEVADDHDCTLGIFLAHITHFSAPKTVSLVTLKAMHRHFHYLCSVYVFNRSIGIPSSHQLLSMIQNESDTLVRMLRQLQEESE